MAIRATVGATSRKKLQALAGDLGRRLRAQPGDVTARPGEGVNEPKGKWIGGERHDDGNRSGRLLRGLHGRVCCRDDDVDFELHQLGGQVGESFILPMSPSPFDGDVLTLYVPELAQPLAESQDWR